MTTENTFILVIILPVFFRNIIQYFTPHLLLLHFNDSHHKNVFQTTTSFRPSVLLSEFRYILVDVPNKKPKPETSYKHSIFLRLLSFFNFYFCIFIRFYSTSKRSPPEYLLKPPTGSQCRVTPVLRLERTYSSSTSFRLLSLYFVHI